MKRIIVGLFLLCNMSVFGQDVIIDEIIAKVGENVVLRSELMFEVEQAKKNYGAEIENLECVVLKQLILKQMLLAQAELDSIPMGEDRVNSDLENKLRFYIRQAGSVPKLEAFLGMSLVEYKEQMRPLIKDQLLVDAMRNDILGSMNASPKEVREYFNSIPSDSLPIYNAEIELARLVINPKVSEVAKKEAYDKIVKLKVRIEKGEDFNILASVWSEDRGSAINGGEMEEFGRKKMQPEFEKASFALKAGEISEIVETVFGYHLIQSIYRKGEMVKVRHILIRPKITETDLYKVQLTMDTVMHRIKSGEITFCEAVGIYSNDEGSKPGCGFYSDQNTGLRTIEMSYFDPDIVAEIKSMKVGDISKPKIIRTYDGSNSYRMLYLKNELPPHKASLSSDYQRLQILALEDKKGRAIETWALKNSSTIFIQVYAPFNKCEEIQSWLNKQ